MFAASAAMPAESFTTVGGVGAFAASTWSMTTPMISHLVGPCVEPVWPGACGSCFRGRSSTDGAFDAAHPSEYHVVCDACGDAR